MRRVVVTGLGCVSPTGLDVESTWSNLLAGKSGITPIDTFDASTHASRIAGLCRGFDAQQYIEKKRLREGDRFIHLALAASQMAVDMSGFEPNEEERERVGTLIGVGMGGLDLLERNHQTLLTRGPGKVSPYFMPAMLANLAPGQVSMRFNFKGPNYTHTSACASGAHAIADGARLIRAGEIDAAICGGAESAVTPLGVSGFTAMRALSTRNDEPERASRPFDAGRDGFVIAEGVGLLLLEEMGAAKKRGARILAEVLGAGATSDAYHLTKPAPHGDGARRAMELALKHAQVTPDEVDYVNAHGTATPNNDLSEGQSLLRVFGKVPDFSSTKAFTGHTLAAAGAVEAVFSLLALKNQTVFANLNWKTPMKEFDLKPQTEIKTKTIKTVLSNSLGFGGNCSTLIFSGI